MYLWLVEPLIIAPADPLSHVAVLRKSKYSRSLVRPTASSIDDRLGKVASAGLGVLVCSSWLVRNNYHPAVHPPKQEDDRQQED
jgi:hypothetical protein